MEVQKRENLKKIQWVQLECTDTFVKGYNGPIENRKNKYEERFLLVCSSFYIFLECLLSLNQRKTHNYIGNSSLC